jgi:hypothetical protein
LLFFAAANVVILARQGGDHEFLRGAEMDGM